MRRWIYLFGVMGLFLFHLVVAGLAPPLPDELYYWCWSQELQLSYYDHPPLTAYLIRLATELFGKSVFAIRFPACLCNFGTLLLLGWLTRPPALLFWMLFTPVYLLGGMLMTPDSPLLFFWTAYLVLLAVLQERLGKDSGGSNWLLWIVGGLLLGLGILSKYSMGLAPIAALMSFAGFRKWTRWVSGFVLHLVVAFIVSLPILCHNVSHDFTPLAFQWHHAMHQSQPTIRHFPEFLCGQYVIAGFLPLAILPWLIMKRHQLWEVPHLRTCWFLFLLPVVFFLYRAFRGRLEVNWPLVCYPAFWPLAANALHHMWANRTWTRWLTVTSFAGPIAFSLVIIWHAISPMEIIQPKLDRISRWRDWHLLSQRIAADVKMRKKVPVLTERYQLTSYLRFQGIPAKQIPGVYRASFFTQTPAEWYAYKQFYFVAERPIDGAKIIRFKRPAPVLSVFPLITRGYLNKTNFLLHYFEKD